MKKVEKEFLSPIQRERLKRGPYFLKQKLRNIEILSEEDEDVLFMNSEKFINAESFEKNEFLIELYRKLIYDKDITGVLKFMFKHKISINFKTL